MERRFVERDFSFFFFLMLYSSSNYENEKKWKSYILTSSAGERKDEDLANDDDL